MEGTYGNALNCAELLSKTRVQVEVGVALDPVPACPCPRVLEARGASAEAHELAAALAGRSPVLAPLIHVEYVRRGSDRIPLATVLRSVERSGLELRLGGRRGEREGDEGGEEGELGELHGGPNGWMIPGRRGVTVVQGLEEMVNG